VSTRGRGEHLHYVDLIRVLTVGLVIGTHVLAVAPVAPTVLLGALGIVFHVSREVFFLLTAFVLTYSTGRKPVRWLKFWRRRYLFVGVPYLTWTVVYFFANGLPYPVPEFFHQILTGTARYHLYFLLVSMQIYLVYPLIRALLRRTRGHHGMLLAFGAVFQLAFSFAVQQQWTLGPLAGWLQAPDAWLPSYLGYVLAGALAGWHRERLVEWTRAHLRAVFGMCGGAIALGLTVYLLQVNLLDQPPLQAAFVFQPVIVVESIAIAWGFLAAGLVWQEHGLRGRPVIRAASDASFGIYLVHPLLLQGVVLVATWTGLADLAQAAPDPLILTALLVLLPLMYVLSGLLTVVTRRTPVSLALTGRARLRHPVASAPRPAPSSSREQLALANSGGSR
jgi:peptidoglycan/LPS O-acetylase OafA/YrhL